MTSLISHASRPFCFISSHFDSSILFWSLLSLPDVALSMYKFLLQAPVGTIMCEPNEAFNDANHKAKLAGKVSKNLYQ